MTSVVESFSSEDDVPHEVRLFTEGAQVGGTIAATSLGAGTYCYSFSVPPVAEGHYSYGVYLVSSGELKATGEFFYSGTDLVYPETGLSAEQLTMLTFIRDVVEADEQYSTATGVARKFIKGTSTILVEKDVVTDTPTNISTTLTEPTP